MALDEHKKRENQTGVLRFKKGTDLKKVPHLVYMLQLMGCLEAIHSALRWLGHTESETSYAKVLDKFMGWNAGAAWCAIAFRLLQEGKAEGAIDPTMLGGQNQLLSLWDRITADRPDETIRKVHRVRDKYFGHFDPKIMEKFIAWQDRIGATEPFFVGDEECTQLESRFLWPLAASIFDLFPHPNDPKRPQKADALVDELADLWAQTGNLIAAFLDSWLRTIGPNFFEVVGGGHA